MREKGSQNQTKGEKMLKKLLTISAAFIITTTAICMQPLDYPIDAQQEHIYEAMGWVRINCPNCHESRVWPSREFVLNRMQMTAEEEQRMIQAITDYTGEIVPGRLCPFCDRELPEVE